MSRPLQIEGMIPTPSFFSLYILEGVHHRPLSDSPLDLSGDISSLLGSDISPDISGVFACSAGGGRGLDSLEKVQLGEAMTGIDTVKSRVGSPCGRDTALTGGTRCCLIGAWHGTCNSTKPQSPFRSLTDSLKNNPLNSGKD